MGDLKRRHRVMTGFVLVVAGCLVIQQSVPHFVRPAFAADCLSPSLSLGEPAWRNAFRQNQQLQLIEALAAKARTQLQVSAIPPISLDKYLAGGVMSESQKRNLLGTAALLRLAFGKKNSNAVIRTISSTEHGGGVAEMRPHTIALFRHLGFRDTEWLIMDGSNEFFDVTAHIHEALHNPYKKSLTQGEYDILQTVWIENFKRLEQEGILQGTDMLWVDDPQPLGLIPLIKQVYPHISIVWRCHVDTSSAVPEVADYLSDLVSGRLETTRDGFLIDYLRQRGYDATRDPASLKADAVVFHAEKFAERMNLDRMIEHVIMGPAIDPLAYKNIPLTSTFIDATLEKYGIKESAKPAPPLVVQISRFDPYKCPLELITAFVHFVAQLEDAELRREVRFVYAGNMPGDNPLNGKLLRQMQEFVARLPVELLPEDLGDIRERIHILPLQDKNKYELVEQLIRETANELRTIKGNEDVHFTARQAEDLRAFLRENRSFPSDAVFRHLQASGIVDPRIIEAIDQGDRGTGIDAGVTFSERQKETVIDLMTEVKRSPEERRRVREDELSGKAINHFEVNALQTWGQVVQFSGREGFGLVVAEAMMAKVWGTPSKPYPVVVATDVGGIGQQVNDKTGVPIHYDSADVDASQKMYDELAEMDREAADAGEWVQGLFSRLRARGTVRRFARGMEAAMTLPREQRDAIHEAAYAHIANHFFTFSNVLNMMTAMIKARDGKTLEKELNRLLADIADLDMKVVSVPKMTCVIEPAI